MYKKYLLIVVSFLLVKPINCFSIKKHLELTAPATCYKITKSIGKWDLNRDTLQLKYINGSIITRSGHRLELVNVNLLDEKDSIITTTSSTLNGEYTLKTFKSGMFRLKFSHVGFLDAYTKSFKLISISKLKIEPIIMDTASTTLSEINVIAKKSYIQRKNDRYILNVENSPFATGDPLELLKRAPFVTVSPTDQITLQDKNTLILIDGKPIPDGSVKNILETLPAGNISKIELITNPSSKYDGAYGSVINIITKKNQTQGLTGVVRVESSIGQYFSNNYNVSLTYKKRSLSVYTILGYKDYNEFYYDGNQRFINENGVENVINDDVSRLYHNNVYTFQTGSDFEFAKNQTLGVIIDGRINYSPNGSFKSITTFNSPQASIDSTLITNSDFNNKETTINYSLDYHLVSDSGKNDLTAIATLTPYTDNITQYFPSELYGPTGSIIRVPPVYQILNPGTVNIFIAQTDYTRLFSKSWRFESGVKYQNSDTKNIVDYQELVNQIFVTSPQYSSNTELNESIYGIYTNIYKNWKNDNLRFGARLEDTHAESAGYFTRNYFDLFPTFLFQHTINDNFNLTLNYRRQIVRPPYQELLPYTIFYDQYTVSRGNPTLLPEFDNLFSINSKLKDFSIQLEYLDGTGTLTQLPSIGGENFQVTTIQLENLNFTHKYTFRVLYSKDVYAWWSTDNSASFGYSDAEGNIAGNNYTLEKGAFNFRTDQTFKLSKIISLDVDGYYYSPSSNGLVSLSSYGNIDASVLIKLFENNAQLRIGGYDLLKRTIYYSYQDYNSYSSKTRSYSDSRILNLGLTYNFGKTKISSLQKDLGNDDAVGRIK